MGKLALNVTNPYGAMSNMPWDIQVGLGLVDGVEYFQKFGFNPDVDGTTEDVWTAGGTNSLLTSAETLNIASSSDADNGGTATGGLAVQIQGLDGNFLEVTENVTLDGQNDVETVNSFIRVNRMFLISAGSGQTNAGDITATASSAGTVQASINAGIGQSEKTQFTVAANKVLLVNSLHCSVSGGTNITGVRVWKEIKVFGTNAWRLIREVILRPSGSGVVIANATSGGNYLPAKCDIRVRAVALSGTDARVTAGYGGYLFERETV